MASSSASDVRKTIIILVAILAAVVLASLVVLMLLPGGQRLIQVTQTESDTAGGDAGIRTEQIDTGFKVNVLQRSSFNALNLGLLQTGILPVRPPSGTGKANPFL